MSADTNKAPSTPTPPGITPATTYLRTQVLTASPEKLRLMLLDGAIRFTRQGRDGILAKDHEAVYTGFTKARDIVVELMTSVRPDTEETLRRRVQGLYSFIFKQLVDASFERDAAKADQAIDLLQYEKETWELAMQKAAEERGGSSTPSRRPSQTAHEPASDRPALSLQG